MTAAHFAPVAVLILGIVFGWVAHILDHGSMNPNRAAIKILLALIVLSAAAYAVAMTALA